MYRGWGRDFSLVGLLSLLPWLESCWHALLCFIIVSMFDAVGTWVAGSSAIAEHSGGT